MDFGIKDSDGSDLPTTNSNNKDANFDAVEVNGNREEVVVTTSPDPRSSCQKKNGKDNNTTDELSAVRDDGAYSIAQQEEADHEVKSKTLDVALSSQGPTDGNKIIGKTKRTTSSNVHHSLKEHLRYLSENNRMYLENKEHSTFLHLEDEYFRNQLECFDLRNKDKVEYLEINTQIKWFTERNFHPLYVNRPRDKTVYTFFKPGDEEVVKKDFYKITGSTLSRVCRIPYIQVDGVKIELIVNVNEEIELNMYYKRDSQTETVFKLCYIHPLDLCLTYVLQETHKNTSSIKHAKHCADCPFDRLLKLPEPKNKILSIQNKLIQLNLNGTLETAKQHFSSLLSCYKHLSDGVEIAEYSSPWFVFKLRDRSSFKKDIIKNGCPTIEIISKLKSENDQELTTIKIRYTPE